MKQTMKNAAVVVLTTGIVVVLGFVLLILVLGESSGGDIRFTVKSTSDGRPIFIFAQNTIDYRRHPFIRFDIQEIFPSRHSSDWLMDEESKPVWSIGEGANEERRNNEHSFDSNGWLTFLPSVTYGECPRGFKELVVAHPLQAGHFYRVGPSSNLIRKNGPCQYEIIPYDRYKEGVKNGQLHDAN